jgi:hypothetical protein
MNRITPFDPNKPIPEPYAQNSPSDSQTSAEKEEQTPTEHQHQTNDEKAPHVQLKEWVIHSSAKIRQANLLKQLEKTQTAGIELQEMASMDQAIPEEADLDDALLGFREKDIAEGGIAELQMLEDQAIATSMIVKQLGAELDLNVISGFSYASSIGKELTTGLNYLGTEWEVRSLELEREAIKEQKAKLPKNHPAIRELSRQQEFIDKKIEKLEESKWQKCFVFLATHIESCLNTIFSVLSHTSEPIALAGAASGSAVVSLAGMGISTYGIVSGAKEYLNINERLANTVQANEKHDNPKIAAALGAVKLAAVDHGAYHQKRNVVFGVFQNAFAFCQGGMTASMGIIGTIAFAAIGTALGTSAAAAAAALGPAIPVVAGIGLLIAGAIIIYQNWNTIKRGVLGLISERGPDKLDRFDPARNLTIRKMKKQKELKEISAKLLEFGSIHAELAETPNKLSSTAESVSFFSSAIAAIKTKASNWILAESVRKITHVDRENIKEVEKAIGELAQKFFDVKLELETIDNKKAAQTLRDETGSISNATVAMTETIQSTIPELETKIRKIDKAIDQLKGKDKKVTIENAYKAQRAQQLKLMKKSEKEITERLEKFSSPSQSTKEGIKEMNQKKIEKLLIQLDKLSLDKTDEIAKLNAEISILKAYVSGNGEAGVDAERTRLTNLLEKVQKDIKQVEEPTQEDINNLIDTYTKKREVLENNIVLLREKLGETVEWAQGAEKTQMILSQNIEALDGEELITFMDIFKEQGISFEGFDNKKNKNLFVQTQIQNAITSNSLKFAA